MVEGSLFELVEVYDGSEGFIGEIYRYDSGRFVNILAFSYRSDDWGDTYALLIPGELL